jgi:hypothetical protein|mmetsp:Transcript_68653/g.109848  ORF Transcript_68653/g.109848 Transcript_68653/m.109848 type:complete len:93 (+) Transcript_68653:991-1269(+)
MGATLFLFSQTGTPPQGESTPPFSDFKPLGHASILTDVHLAFPNGCPRACPVANTFLPLLDTPEHGVALLGHHSVPAPAQLAVQHDLWTVSV